MLLFIKSYLQMVCGSFSLFFSFKIDCFIVRSDFCVCKQVDLYLLRCVIFPCACF